MTEKINKQKLDLAIIEIKLSINRSLFEKELITKEMFVKAKELILKSWHNIYIDV